MTTQQFYELPLGITFTLNELLTINDALFVASEHYTQKKLNNIAKENCELWEKIHTFINKAQKLK